MSGKDREECYRQKESIQEDQQRMAFQRTEKDS